MATLYAFGALKSNGNVTVWGLKIYGADTNNNVDNTADLGLGVQSLIANEYAMAALLTTGKVITWGHSGSGGDLSSASSEILAALASNVTAIALPSEERWLQEYFLAWSTDGNMIVWGGQNDWSFYQIFPGGQHAVMVQAGAMVVLKHDGSAETCCNNANPLASASTDYPDEFVNVTSAISTTAAFAILRSDGSVFSLGEFSDGDWPWSNASSVQSDLNRGVVAIYAGTLAMAAVKEDGSVVAWGNSEYGGSVGNISNVTKIFASRVLYYPTFIAKKSDGTIEVWGDSRAASIPSGIWTTTTSRTHTSSTSTSATKTTLTSSSATSTSSTFTTSSTTLTRTTVTSSRSQAQQFAHAKNQKDRCLSNILDLRASLLKSLSWCF